MQNKEKLTVERALMHDLESWDVTTTPEHITMELLRYWHAISGTVCGCWKLNAEGVRWSNGFDSSIYTEIIPHKIA